MKKTSKMLEIERKIGENLEDFLRRKYVDNKRNIVEIADVLHVNSHIASQLLDSFNIPKRSRYELITLRNLKKGIKKPPKTELERLYVDEKISAASIARQKGVHENTVINWLESYGIERRYGSETKLPKGINKPTKKELEKLYVKERKSTIEIAEIYHVYNRTVGQWLQSYEIPRRTISEAHLPKNFTKPTKAQLTRWYVKERMSTVQIADNLGVSNPTVAEWMKSDGIPRRTISEAQLPIGFKKPTREELEKWYSEDNMTVDEIGKQLKVGKTSVYRWIKDYGIRRMSHIKYNKQFLEFLAKDETARNLSSAAVILNGQSVDVEKIITELYEGKFQDQAHLHKLLQENTAQIYELIKEGTTNLGAYIGEFSLGDRKIIPVLIGQAVTNIPEDRVTPSLEDRLVRILRLNYSPRFNDDPNGTIAEIQERMNSSSGKVKTLYERLYQHYQKVIQLGEQLK